MVTRIKADGHEVGNHYVMDASVLVHSDAAFLDYLEKSDKAIGIETRPKLFRPPGGVAWPKELRVALTHGHGSAYANDPTHPPVCYIRWGLKRISSLAPSSSFTTASRTRGGVFRLCRTSLLPGSRRVGAFVSVGALMRGAVEQMGTASTSDNL